MRTKNVWIVFLVFKGSDLHSGFAPSEDPQAHKRWVDENVSAAWNIAGPQNRVGYVSYIGSVPSDRLGSINITPPTLFGNYGSNQVHKSKQKTFAMNGHNTLGGTPAYAERMGREIVANFWNSLQYCDLNFDQDMNELMSNISFKDPETNSQVKLGPLPFNPQRQRKVIERYLGLYAWHKREAVLFHVNIPKARLLANKNKKTLPAGSAMVQDAGLWSHRRQQLTLPPTQPLANDSEATEITPLEPLNIEKVLGKAVKNGKLHYVVQIKDAEPMEIEEDSLRYVVSTFCSIKVSDEKLSIKGNAILLEYLRSDMLSKVPDHPALALLSPTPQDSPTALTQATRSTAEGNQAVNNNNLTSTIAASTSNKATQLKEGSRADKNLKRKTPAGRDKQPLAVSYEVEEISGHRQDKQARN
jgi:hypothetical protein